MASNNPRKAYGETLVELGRENDRIVVLEADLGKSTMSHGFQETFPDRYFEMGISEQNMTSFAAGLALSGKIAFTNSFAVFAAGRAYDQIRQGIAIPGLNVKIVGSSSGLSDFGDGSTHQSIDDIAIMRAIPNMTVLVPMDSVETRKIVREAARHEGPVYIRMTRNDVPDLFPAHQDFRIGEPYVIRQGKDVTVFACGVMVPRAVGAAQKLENEGIFLRVIDVSSIKPLNSQKIRELAADVKGVITAEEHSIVGGLSETIAYILRESGKPFRSVAVMDCFGQSARSYEELMAHYGLTEENIMENARKIMTR